MGHQFYAHSLEGNPDEKEWQLLEDHLRGVAERAGRFCEPFLAREHGFVAGLWHDLGKYLPAFQRRLHGESIQVPHAAIGAALAWSRSAASGIPIAFAVAGHHAGLANLVRSEHNAPLPLKECVGAAKNNLKVALDNAPDLVTAVGIPSLPSFLHPEPSVQEAVSHRRTEFWIRLLFSALVDADRLDTEAFCNPEQARERGAYEPIAALRDRLQAYLRNMMAALPESKRHLPVNQARADIVVRSLEAAQRPPGFFSLTVPTGGGKTLSGMAFALAHAETNNLRRVIVVIPYTSIIEQNAAIYKAVLGNGNVIEHHSNFDPEREDVDETYAFQQTLACENWDAPVIVTTTVQFFESLFSNHPSRCRKIHNITQSVIVLDEVQTLPPSFLSSILDVLKDLVAYCGCTVVLSTATPPALACRQSLPEGLPDVHAIIPEPCELAQRLKRVNYTWPTPNVPPREWPDLAQDIAGLDQVLAVVHRRKDARDLAQYVQSIVPDDPIFHLSALMCPRHRLDVLDRIRKVLASGGICRVISTQLVEAGVDLDFPVVYRALGGLDSIVQAAGRCNREGRREAGRVVIFRAPTKPPPDTPTKAFDVTNSMLNETGVLDPSDLAVFEEYFRRLYFVEERDVHAIQTERAQLNFATVAARFKLIEDGYTRPIIVAYGDSEERLARLRMFGPSAQRVRALQLFTVNVHVRIFDQWLQHGALEEASEGFFALASPFHHLYDPVYGLLDTGEASPNPESLVI